MRHLLLYLSCIITLVFSAIAAESATVSGHVFDPSGKPIAGATVYIFSQTQFDKPQSTTTDATGAFTADVASTDIQKPMAFVGCMADAPGFAPSGCTIKGSGDTVIKLARPVTVTGTVVDNDGHPLAGVSVSAEYALGPGPIGAEGPSTFSLFVVGPLAARYTVKTDDKGQYSIPNVPENTSVQMLVTDPEYAQTNATTEPGSLVAPPIKTSLAASITGRVLNTDGTPAVGIRIFAQGANGIVMAGNYGLGTKTGQDGTYKIRGLAPGTYSVSPFQVDGAAAWNSPASVSVTTSLDKPGTAPDIILHPGGTVTGLVIDQITKKPLSGVQVWAVDPSLPQSNRTVSAVTDSAGRYTLEVWAGSAQINASVWSGQPFGNDSGTKQTVAVSAGQTVTADPIALAAGATVTGKIVRQDGKPTGPVNITVERIQLNGSPGRPVITAADGSYTVNGVPPGSYAISAQPVADSGALPDWVPPAPVAFTVTGSSPITLPDLLLTPGALVSGVVIDSDTKKPVPGVGLGIQDPLSQGLQTRSINGITDQNGAFTFRVWPGKANLYVYSAPAGYVSDFESSEHTVTVVQGQDQTLDPISINHGQSFGGVVVDETGKPVANLSLQAQKITDGGGWMNIQPVVTGTDGAFSIDQLAPGSYSLDAGAAWTVTSPPVVVVPAAGPVRVVLKPTVTTTLQGTVVDTAGVPLAGVAVSFDSDHTSSNGNDTGADVNATTDKDGYFSLPNVAIQPDMVQRDSITKDGYVYKSGGDVTRQGNNLSVSLIVMAKLGGVVNGIVRNGLNAPVAGAWVSCPSTNGDILPIQTDADGHFQLTNQILGPIKIFADKGRYFGELEFTATATPGQTATVALSPMPPPPAPSDMASGQQMLAKIVTDLSSNSRGLRAWRVRDDCARALATVSLPAALNFIESRGSINSGDLQWIVPTQSQLNPSAAAEWGLPLVQNTKDNGYLTGLAADLGLEIARYNIAAATTLYGIAAKSVDFDHLTKDNIDNAIDLSALAYAIKSPDADADYQKVMAEIKSEIAASKPNPSGWNDTDSLLDEFAEDMAKSNIELAKQILSTMTQNKRLNETSNIVAAIARSNPDGAVAIFHTLDGDAGTPTGAWAYNRSLAEVLPTIYKTDPKGAMALAQSVDDPTSQAQSLAEIADLLPLDQAKPVYVKAEAEVVGQTGSDGATPESIAAHALLRDSTLGTELFKQAYDKVIAGAAQYQPWQEPYPEFAFYYSRLAPGYSRLLLEDAFVKDNINPSQNYGEGTGVGADAAAMAAIDPARAFELAEQITDDQIRERAAIAVAEYILQSQQTRDTLSFANWSGGYDWVPDPTAPW